MDFSVVSGDAAVLVESAVSDSAGYAYTHVRLGDSPGAVLVSASVFGHDAAVEFRITVTDEGPDTTATPGGVPLLVTSTSGDMGFRPAGTAIDLYCRSEFGGREYWAFSSRLGAHATASDRAVFLDPDNSLAMGGSVVDTVAIDHWVLHLDDAASAQIDDDDDDIVVSIRVE